MGNAQQAVKKTVNYTRVATIVLWCVLALLGVVTLLVVTRWGIGVTPDSVAYVAATRNILDSRGISVPDYDRAVIAPMTHWPPLFPILLSGICLLGTEVLEAGRWLNAFVFAGNVLLAGAVLHRCTGRSWLALVGAFVVLNSAQLIDVHLMLWTEPVFMFLGLLGLAMLGSHLENPKLPLLIGAGVAVALAFLSRYLGIVLVGAAVVGILLLSQRTWKRRMVDCGLFALVSCLPMAFWVIRNRLVAHSMTNREVMFHPVEGEKIRLAALTVSRWFLPESLPEIVKMVFVPALLLGLAVLTALPFTRGARAAQGPPAESRGRKIPLLLMIFLISYAVFLLVSISFFDANTPLDNRILSPLNLTALILLFCCADKLLHHARALGVVRIALIVVVGVFALLKARQNVEMNFLGRSDGEGFSSRRWRESNILDSRPIQELPAGAVLYSNVPEAIYLHAYLHHSPRGEAYSVPSRFNPLTRAERADYPAEMKAMEHKLRQNGGFVVYLTDGGRAYLPSREQLTSHLSVTAVLERDDGTIYVLQ